MAKSSRADVALRAALGRWAVRLPEGGRQKGGGVYGLLEEDSCSTAMRFGVSAIKTGRPPGCGTGQRGLRVFLWQSDGDSREEARLDTLTRMFGIYCKGWREAGCAGDDGKQRRLLIICCVA